jgi:uncharacterized membrane protein HdeD (DUF308 family)
MPATAKPNPHKSLFIADRTVPNITPTPLPGLVLIPLGLISLLGQVWFAFLNLEFFGLFFILAGLIQSIHIVDISGWKITNLQWLSAGLYILIGLIIWFDSHASQTMNVWLVGGLVVLTSALRLHYALNHPCSIAWLLIAIASAALMAVSIFMIAQLPTSYFLQPTLLIAIELQLQGLTLLALSKATQHPPH